MEDIDIYIYISDDDDSDVSTFFISNQNKKDFDHISSCRNDMGRMSSMIVLSFVKFNKNRKWTVICLIIFTFISIIYHFFMSVLIPEK